jgi:hypothetical protein
VARIRTELQEVVDSVVRRARKQGYVVPTEVREELARFGVSEDCWKEVIRRTDGGLHFRRGRYYFVSPLSRSATRIDERRREVRRIAMQLIRDYRAARVHQERRQQRRIPLILPVRVITERNRKIPCVTQDMSPTGVRLVGSTRLQGQRVHVLIPQREHGKGQHCFIARIVWSIEVGDGLVENGGLLLEVCDLAVHAADDDNGG